MMNNKVLKSRRIIFCLGDDRIVLVVKEANEIVGLNYMQGDDLEYFKDFKEIDQDLTDFFKVIEPHLIHDDQIDRITAAIWAHFEYRNLRDSRKAL